jgi:tRNA threonylcarbamoyladenosine dehydratase
VLGFLVSYALLPRRIPLDEEDVSLIVEDVHLGRSVIPPHTVPTRPALVRWDPSAPLTPENVVLMDTNDADRHTLETTGVDLGPVGRKKQAFVTPESELTHAPLENAPVLKKPEELWGKEVRKLIEDRKEVFERWRREVIKS